MGIRTWIGLEYPGNEHEGEKRRKKRKKKVIQFLFFSFFPSLLIFLLTACSLHFDIIIAFSFHSLLIPLFSLQIYAFFLTYMCTQQICQVHFISFCFLFLKNGHAWVDITYHIICTYFFILRSIVQCTEYRVHHHHTEYNIGWPISALWYHALFSPNLSLSFLVCFDSLGYHYIYGVFTCIRWLILYTLLSDISVDVCCILSYTLLHYIPYTHVYRIQSTSLLILLRTSVSSYQLTYIAMPGTGTEYRLNDLSVCTWVTMHAYFVHTTHAWLYYMPAVHYTSLHYTTMVIIIVVEL